METLIDMKDRHRIERMNARKLPIGLILMAILPVLAGFALTWLFNFFWGLWFAIFEGMALSFNAFVIRRRLEKLAEKHQRELSTRSSPVAIVEVLE